MSIPARRHDDISITKRVRRLLCRHLAERMPSLEEVAAEFAMAPGTLRRHLRMEGANYTAIKIDLRRTAAIELLARPELNLQVIAESVGLSDASTFYEAFKSWTGVTPGDYRRKLHDGSQPAQSRDTSAGFAE
jgi:AraC-like DNA-binding protein